MSSEEWTIYRHTHIGSGRHYVGLTRMSMMRRWKGHVRVAMREGNHKESRYHFANAIRQYGKDAFTHEILEKCSTLEEANAAEIKWIEHLDTTNPEKGFNIKVGGDHTPHPIKNPWERPGFREAALERMAPLYTDPTWLAKVTKASRDAMGDPDIRKKIGEAVSASAKDPEVRAKISAGQRGKTLSQEHRAKIKAASRNQDPEVKERIRKATHSDMATKKRRESIKEYWSDPKSHEKARMISRMIHDRPEVKAKLLNHKLNDDSLQLISDIIRQKYQTSTHKICKIHGEVPLDKCITRKNRRSSSYRCGFCIIDQRKIRRSRRAIQGQK